MADKVAAARKIEELLKSAIRHGGFKLKYRITVDPPLPEDRDWERPAIVVELAGPDSPLMLERGAELLRSLEHLAQQMLHLPQDEHDKVSFDCMNFRAQRLEELRTAAGVAAERVRKTGMPYEFGPMTSRERRVVHLALRDFPELKTESTGEGGDRHVVVLPKDYKPRQQSAIMSRPRGRR
ncbi:MAG TPA: R3H domain-containing nucleic acid-binding protein [Terriglobales bacterium]|nr:R3H domain-containing nucleic acid-binding protein [Terriglobales bacterium]